MTITRTTSAGALVLALWSAVFVSRAAAGQDALARAKDLYTSAAYDEALAVLNQFDHTSAKDVVEVNQYRALCLLALGRSDDARQVIQQIVEANPSFQPSDTQVSPRLQEAFRDVRRRVLPSLVRQSYADAKGAFEHGEFELAAKRFEGVIALLKDAEGIGSAELGALSDLGILSNGFMELIRTMPKPATAQVRPAQIPRELPPAPSSIYGADDPDVTPPVAISQNVPPWRPWRLEKQTYEGTLIVVIDERGEVTSVSSHGGLQPAYDLLLRRAASQWKFRPATRNGLPVKYRKIVAIHLGGSDATRTGRDDR